MVGTQLSLRWAPPADMGGRQDVRYNVGCSQCQGAALESGPCQPCGRSVHFSPGASGLTLPTVRVHGLEPYTNYTFSVEAQNGVSGLASSSQASASLSISMGHAGEGWGGTHWAWRNQKGLGPQGRVMGGKPSKSCSSYCSLSSQIHRNPLDSQSHCQAYP